MGAPIAETRVIPAQCEQDGYRLAAQVSVRDNREVINIEGGLIHSGDTEVGTFAYYPQNSQIVFNVYYLPAADRKTVYNAVEIFVTTAIGSFGGVDTE